MDLSATKWYNKIACTLARDKFEEGLKRKVLQGLLQTKSAFIVKIVFNILIDVPFPIDPCWSQYARDSLSPIQRLFEVSLIIKVKLKNNGGGRQLKTDGH